MVVTLAELAEAGTPLGLVGPLDRPGGGCTQAKDRQPVRMKWSVPQKLGQRLLRGGRAEVRNCLQQ